MSLIHCKEPLCQSTAGCICERQLRSSRIVLDVPSTDLPTLMRLEAAAQVSGGFYTVAGSLLASGAAEIERLRALPTPPKEEK